MSERKINLEEILLDIFQTTTQGCSSSTQGLQLAIIRNPDLNRIKNAMKEACKQTLELAAENAEVDIIDHEEVDKSKLPGTDNFATLPIYGVDEQSILNTINQIE